MTKLFKVSKYIVLFILVTCCNKNQKCQYFMKACITFIFILCVICTMCSKWPDADLLKSPPARNAVCLAMAIKCYFVCRATLIQVCRLLWVIWNRKSLQVRILNVMNEVIQLLSKNSVHNHFWFQCHLLVLESILML